MHRSNLSDIAYIGSALLKIKASVSIEKVMGILNLTAFKNVQHLSYAMFYIAKINSSLQNIDLLINRSTVGLKHFTEFYGFDIHRRFPELKICSDPQLTLTEQVNTSLNDSINMQNTLYKTTSFSRN